MPMMNRFHRDSDANTIAVPSQYEETVVVHDREFQKFSIDHSIHLVPVDEVRNG